MKRKEIKYFSLIVVGLFLIVALYNTFLVKQVPPLNQASYSNSSVESNGISFPSMWVGNAKLSTLLGVELNGFIQFKLNGNGKIVVAQSIGKQQITETPVDISYDDENNAAIKWSSGYDAYEFSFDINEASGDLYVTRDGTRYLVMMNTHQSHILADNQNVFTRLIDNTLSVLLEGVVLLLPIWIVLLISYVFVAGLLYLIFWKLLKNVLKKRKVQEEMPKDGTVSFEIKHSIVAVFAIGFFSYFLTWVIQSGYSQSYRDIEEYGWWYWSFSLIALLLLVDTYVYWTHRLMHHRKLFKYFHKVHHFSHRPTPWTTWSINVNEVIVNAMFVPIVILFLPLHELTLIVFSIVSLVKNVFNHIGFEVFPKGSNKGILKWIVTPTFHELHHVNFNSNYSAFFTWWDKWMGTDHNQYDTIFEKAHSA